MATRGIASWACALQWSAIPQVVRRASSRSLYNYIGCAIGGCGHPTVQKAHEALQDFYGPRNCSLLGTNICMDAQHASLLNGIASHVHDYDDTHLETIIHPTGPVASAALAYAQHKPGFSGEEVLTAVIAGIEAECKVGLAVWPEHYDIGFHITSTVGSIGAAVAVGKLMRLDEEHMVNAIGIAAVQIIGLREMFGSDTKSFHPGRAAQSGLLAALLAEKGYTSSANGGLEAKRGWANVVAGGGTPKLDHYVAELGTTWETEKNTFKPYPCGIVKHPIIHAACLMHDSFGLSEAELVKRLETLHFEVKVHPLVIELTSKPMPHDGLQAKFSVAHGAAVGLLYGKAGPAQYSDETVRDPVVIKVRDSVEPFASKEIRSDEAVIIAIDSSGKNVSEIHVEHAVGSLEMPLTDAQLQVKFKDQVSLQIGMARADKASTAAWSIAEAEDISQVLQRLSSV